MLDLSLGNPGGTHERLEPLVAHAAANGLREPTMTAFVVDDIEALVALDRLDEAQTLLERFEEPARALDRASALASSGRCRGLLAAARGDVGAALVALEGALDDHERSLRPFDRARTLLVLGRVLRRARQKGGARAALHEALDVFEQLGAALWAEQTRAELARIGGRPPSSGKLTPGERRVADLVAEGRSNKEVAAALFISPQTVESHLKKVYAKLGVRSRSELTRRFVAGEPERTST